MVLSLQPEHSIDFVSRDLLVHFMRKLQAHVLLIMCPRGSTARNLRGSRGRVPVLPARPGRHFSWVAAPTAPSSGRQSKGRAQAAGGADSTAPLNRGL